MGKPDVDELIERLRAASGGYQNPPDLIVEAADALASLQRERDELRERLTEVDQNYQLAHRRAADNLHLAIEAQEESKAAEERGRAAERERCAKVADQYVWDDHALAQATDIGRAVHYQSVEIASAIRKGGE